MATPALPTSLWILKHLLSKYFAGDILGTGNMQSDNLAWPTCSLTGSLGYAYRFSELDVTEIGNTEINL